MRCDFCSSQEPAWRYPAATFLDAVGSVSQEDWLACDECQELIEAEQRDALARRAMHCIGMRPDKFRAEFAFCKDLHDRFWRARLGSPYRIAA